MAERFRRGSIQHRSLRRLKKESDGRMRLVKPEGQVYELFEEC